MVGWSLIGRNIWAWIHWTLLPLALLPELTTENGVALRPALAHSMSGPEAQVDASLSATLLICGLILLVLAEEFRIGRDLRIENEAFV